MLLAHCRPWSLFPVPCSQFPLHYVVPRKTECALSDVVARLNEALADRYRIDREVGAGGMATVYLAEDLRHRRRVALKVLRPDLSAAMGAERFVREIGIAASLQHPHILPLYDSGQAGEFLYYVMPFVEGASLRDRMAREGALPVGEAVRLLREVADALAEAHRHKVVHRDIKPENVMLSGRHAVVTDFGVARAVSEAGGGSLTATGIAIGTPAYMAPEQATADPSLDHRADIYAFGALAYEILAGRPVFQQATAQGLIAAHVTTSPERLSTHRPAVPPSLEALVMRCLEKRAADRPQSADELVAALEAMPVSGVSSPASSPPVPARRRRLLPVAVAVVLTLALGSVWLVTSNRASAAALDPDLVLALPFRVTATSPELIKLREGVVDILQASLGASSGPRVVAAQTAIVAWQRAGGGDGRDLTEAEAGEVARALGAAYVLTGSVVQQGGGYVMAATLTPTLGGRSLQGRVEGPADSTLVLVSRLVSQLLSLRAGEESGRASSLADIPLPALQAYLDGQRAWRAGRWAEALDGFGRALAADSTFALAGLYHSLAAGWNLGGPPSPGPAIARAHLDRLSDRDRVMASVILNLPGDSTVAGMIASRERAVTQLSDRAEAWYLLGDQIYHYGQVAGLSEAEQEQRAWAAFNRGLALDPGFGPILAHVLDRHLLPNPDTAAYRRAKAQHPSVARERYIASIEAAVFRDTAALRAFKATANSAELFGHAFAVGWLGSADDAIEVLRLRVQRATSSQERLSSLEAAEDLAWSSGRPNLAARISSELGVQPGVPGLMDHARRIIAALVYDADETMAATSAAALEALAPASLTQPPGVEGAVAAWLAGLWRAHEGNHPRVADLARRLEAWGPLGRTTGERGFARVGAETLQLALTTDPESLGRRARNLDDFLATGPLAQPTLRSLANLLAARALGEAGEHEPAARAARRFDHFDQLLFAGLVQERGRQLLLAGDSTEAFKVLQTYLRFRAQAEPAQRAKDDVIRQELARLVGEPRN